VAGSCEHGNELPGSKKGSEFLELLTIRLSRMNLLYGFSQVISSHDGIIIEPIKLEYFVHYININI
jgi:hypothetical protein